MVMGVESWPEKRGFASYGYYNTKSGLYRMITKVIIILVSLSYLEAHQAIWEDLD